MLLVKVIILTISTVGIGCQIIRKLVTRSHQRSKKSTPFPRKQCNMGSMVCVVTYITYIQSAPNILPFGFYPNPSIFYVISVSFCMSALIKKNINYSLPTALISLILLLFWSQSICWMNLSNSSYTMCCFLLFWDTARFHVFLDALASLDLKL